MCWSSHRPGRPGSLTTLEGDDVYEDVTLTAKCMVADPDVIPVLAGWLKGGGTVTFANREGGFYYARIVNQIPFEKILRGNPHRAFSVNFRCKPFWYENPGEPITLTAASNVLVNPGSAYSEPVIAVNGSGDITLIVNGEFIELTDIEGGITLNSEILEAYHNPDERTHGWRVPAAQAGQQPDQLDRRSVQCGHPAELEIFVIMGWR